MKKLVLGIIFVLVLVSVFFVFQIAGNYKKNALSEGTSQNNGLIEGGAQSDESESQQSQSGEQLETSSTPQTHNIEISGFSFNPSSLTIKVGDSVVWTNRDSASHTLTSDSGSELNSDYLLRNEQYNHTFNQAGTFDYHCEPHPYIKGRIIVE